MRAPLVHRPREGGTFKEPYQALAVWSSKSEKAPIRCWTQVARRRMLGYRGRTMTRKRAGRTVKVSVSLDRQDVAALRRRARDSYGGNLSAAFADAARWIRQREARQRLVEMLGGPTLTAASAAAIDAEQERGARDQPTKRRRTRAA